MPESRSDLKKIIDGLNASLPEKNREAYKASTNIADLNAIIDSLKAKISEEPEPADESDDGFSDDNAVVDDVNAPTSEENVSDDESVTEGEKNVSRPNMSDSDIPMKECKGNHSNYPDTKENFPNKYGGRYSVDYLVSKRLMKK